MDVTIVGVGKVGGALAIALTKANHQIRQMIVRNCKIAGRVRSIIGAQVDIHTWKSVRTIDSSLVLICTGDSEITNVAETLKNFLVPGQVVLHTSGSLPSTILGPLSAIGCETGSLHPLVSVSDPIKGSNSLERVYFCIEGSTRAVSVSRKIARDIGGKPFTIPTDKKALYHASAVTVAGHMVALFAAGVEMLQACGISESEARKVLLPLSKSSLENLSTQSPGKALTGTFARLDVDGLARHIAAFDAIPADLREVYYLLGEQSLSLLEQSSNTDPRIGEMRRLIFVAKAKRR